MLIILKNIYIKYTKFKLIFFFCIFNFFLIKDNDKLASLNIKNFSSYLKNHLKVSSFYNLSNNINTNKTILIIEPNEFHHECLPGFSKYFIDLGFNIDIIMKYNSIDSFSLFENQEKIKIFTFKNRNELYLNSKNISSIIKKYKYILVQTYYIFLKNLYIKLDLLNNNNTIFVYHGARFDMTDFPYFFKQKRVLTLANFSKGFYVNPHYFGNIKLRNKNKKVRFFLTSTIDRNYNYLIESIERLYNENYYFDIIVTGRTLNFNRNNIPKKLKNIIIFKHKVSYIELFKIVYYSDYIIIPLIPNNSFDLVYKTKRATGSIQLVYGFSKPALINEEFANIYKLNKNNSLIYNNTNLFHIMRKAILLNSKSYKKLRNNLKITEKNIYKESINNIKKIIEENK